jgi:8-oxo-dGTP diphosphatase
MSIAALVHVAVGVIRRSHDGAVLLASRPSGKVYAGWWEFSGGKLEPTETVEEALRRELHEELGITVLHTHPAWEITHRYDHAHVHLHFCWVTHWTGTPVAQEGQQLCWVTPQGPFPSPLLPATIPALAQLQQGIEPDSPTLPAGTIP